MLVDKKTLHLQKIKLMKVQPRKPVKSNENKISVPSNKNKSIADFVEEYGEGFKDAIFNHEEAKAMFDERIKAIRLTATPESFLVIKAFRKLLPELSDNTLNLSDVDGEYQQLVSLLTKKNETEYTQHPGIFILMVNTLRKNPAKLYCDNIGERQCVFIACSAVLKSIKALHEPIRDAVINEFWDAATDDQKADIRSIAKHHMNPSAAGMPMNGAIPQYRG